MMQRVYGLVDDELVHRIDKKAGEEKVSRAQWVRIAIEAYLHRGGEQESLETVNLRNEAVKLREEAVNLSTALDEKGKEIAHLKDGLAAKDGELEDLRFKLSELQSKYDQNIAEANRRWEELRSLRGEITQFKKEADEFKALNQKLQDELARSKLESQKAVSESEVMKAKAESYLQALKLKDDEIAFLRAVVHQLTEKITPALPPGQEEARAKSWWQFWK